MKTKPKGKGGKDKEMPPMKPGKKPPFMMGKRKG